MTTFPTVVTEVDIYVINKVRDMRKEKDVSQAQLAFELDIATSFIGMVESGRYNKKYSVAQLNGIAKILDCSPKDFLPENPL